VATVVGAVAGGALCIAVEAIDAAYVAVQWNAAVPDVVAAVVAALALSWACLKIKAGTETLVRSLAKSLARRKTGAATGMVVGAITGITMGLLGAAFFCNMIQSAGLGDAALHQPTPRKELPDITLSTLIHSSMHNSDTLVLTILFAFMGMLIGLLSGALFGAFCDDMVPHWLPLYTRAGLGCAIVFAAMATLPKVAMATLLPSMMCGAGMKALSRNSSSAPLTALAMSGNPARVAPLAKLAV